MTATRVRGWRTGLRRRRSTSTAAGGDDWIQRQAKQFAGALRARLTDSCEKILRQVYPGVAYYMLRVNAAGLIGAEVRIAHDLRRLIDAAAAEVGEPADSLDVEVCMNRSARTGLPILTAIFKMPEHSDQEHLRRVLAQLAAAHGGKAT